MTITSSISAQPLDEFLEALLAIDRFAARQILSTYGQRAGTVNLFEQMIVPALEQIGAQWEQGALSLAQVYMSGHICEEIVDAILPPAQIQRISHPPIAIAVLEDYHLLGKRMVYASLRASGYEIRDFGQVTVEALVAQVIQERIAVLLISVLMLPSALRIKELRQQLERAGHRPKIIVGGAPFRFDEILWQEIGADAMGKTAIDAVTHVGRLLKELP
ncbi:cobalamin-binding protein [Chloroflexales bacterium ZM16-3]|nr:cobalamin-binding protein [Chloroflexales bacterium ZM16-3]